MSKQKQYFYIPDNRVFAVISQLIPKDSWNSHHNYLIFMSSPDGVFELEFGSLKGVKLLSDALLKFLNTDNVSNSIQTFVFDN